MSSLFPETRSDHHQQGPADALGSNLRSTTSTSSSSSLLDNNATNSSLLDAQRRLNEQRLRTEARRLLAKSGPRHFRPADVGGAVGGEEGGESILAGNLLRRRLSALAFASSTSGGGKNSSPTSAARRMSLPPDALPGGCRRGTSEAHTVTSESSSEEFSQPSSPMDATGAVVVGGGDGGPPKPDPRSFSGAFRPPPPHQGSSTGAVVVRSATKRHQSRASVDLGNASGKKRSFEETMAVAAAPIIPSSSAREAAASRIKLDLARLEEERVLGLILRRQKQRREEAAKLEVELARLEEQQALELAIRQQQQQRQNLHQEEGDAQQQRNRESQIMRDAMAAISVDNVSTLNRRRSLAAALPTRSTLRGDSVSTGSAVSFRGDCIS